MLVPRLVLARTQREAFRLRGEHGLLEAVADRRSLDTAFVARRILCVLPVESGDRILDIGCGDGEFLRRVTPLVNWAVGIDLSSRGLLQVRSRLGDSKTLFCCGLSEALPFPTGLFSKVVINSVLYALGSHEEAERTVGEVRRVLSPQGLAYFGEVPTLDERRGAKPRSGVLGTAVAKFRRHGIRTLLRLLRERRHAALQIISPDTFLYWRKEEFAALLEKHGFEISLVFPHKTLSGPTTRLNYVAVNAHGGF